jgi:UDP-N-acetylglucosamine diphosphorylase / glucose-1-phosphate thymidylyltransferase / UDP-N-acetylgalactosamine diphosphorylase / glucosamine-1-phosphate N-acetyltransferase / galactosamine-1-phosphate N-acetyltransferase
MTLVLFDGTNRNSFYPISLTRALFDLKIGCKTSFEHFSQQPLKLLTEGYLEDITRTRHGSTRVNNWGYDKDDIYLNSLFIIKESKIRELSKRNDPFVLKNEGTILAARINQKDSEYIRDSLINGKGIGARQLEADKIEVDNIEDLGTFFDNIWCLTSNSPRILASQLMEMSKDITKKEDLNLTARCEKVRGNGPLYVHDNCSVDDEVVLDTTDGAIWIDEGAEIVQSTIYGPAFIGKDTKIKPYSIVSNSYIGKNCRIAGEVDSSTVSDYSNKSHAGYIGHSFIGEWVNIGANTSTSDLKMTYGNISVSTYREREKIDTGLIKLGSFFGDMVKTSIGTNIYGGLQLGIASHLHGIVTQDVPSFVIYGQGIGAENVEMDLESAIRTQERMMSRRDMEITPEYEKLIRLLFKNTSDDRLRKGISSKKFRL